MNANLLKNITPELLDTLTIEERSNVNKLLKEIKERRSLYPLLDVKLNEDQTEFLNAVAERNEDWTPRYKIFVFLWGNGSWKTFTNMYITMLKSLGNELCRKYNLPEVGDAHLISINTTTWSNISKNLDKKYLLWTWTDNDVMKFPWYVNRENKWEIVKTVRWDKAILKDIELKRGTSITFWTYDQGQARLQGAEPIWTSMDELPTRFDDLIEIVRGNRNKMGQLFISATPTNYNKKIHNYLFNEKMKDTVFIRQVDSFNNKHADHSWMEGLSDEEIKIRRFWSFIPPEGLVYKEFNRDSNVVEHFSPNILGRNVRYYGSVDFGVKHPLAFLLIAVDEDGHIYIFDMFYKSGASMKEVADWVKAKKREYGIELEYIIADSAGARERLELKEEGIITKKAKKKQKEGTMSNRRGWIMRINAELKKGSLIISDSDACKPLIEEMEVHHYKETGEDWTVEKTDDDALDALRYFVFSYLVPSEKKNLKRQRRKIGKRAQKSRRY